MSEINNLIRVAALAHCKATGTNYEVVKDVAEEPMRQAIEAYEAAKSEGQPVSSEEAIELDKACATLNRRIKKAMKMLSDMIDGGEECRGRDSEISNIIYILRGDTYHAE